MSFATTPARSTFSIRTSLLATVAVLAALSTGGFGWRAAEDSGRLSAAKSAAEADSAANRFAAGLFEVLLERMTTNNALQAAEPAGADTLAEINRRRAAVQAQFVPGLEVLARKPFPGRDALLADLRGAQQRADAARRATDAAMRLPKESRDAALLRDYLPQINAFVASATQLWFAASHAVAATDPQLARLAVVKELGWRMRETAGTERSGVASYIVTARPVPVDSIAAHAAMRSRVDQLWAMLENLAPAADPATHPALRTAQAEARSGYFEGFRPFVDRTVAGGAEGGRYTVPVATFTNTTTPQLGTLLGIMHAGATASEARTAALVQRAWLDIGIAALLMLLALGTALLALYVVLRRVARPLTTLAATTDRLAAGDLGIEVAGTERGDEVGALARGLQTLRDGTRRARELEATAAEQRATRDRRQAATERHTENFATSITGIMATLGGSAGAMRTAAGAMAEVVAQSRDAASHTAKGSLESSRNLSAVAAATDELSASVSEITRQVAQAASAAQDAVSRAEATDATVRGLSEAAGQIGDVVRMISDIAGQTNLLALNATIEAARAGESGKGFAVVASEVKQLAAQTARATEQIAAQVSAIQGATQQAVGAVQEVGQAIGRMNEVASAIAAAVEQQGAATREIAGQVAMVAGQTQEAAGAMQQVSDASERAGGNSRSVLAAANDVAQVSDKLRLEVDQFLAAMNAEDEERGIRAG